jgi:site-specific DNA-methyltransferase (adenine-specific)
MKPDREYSGRANIRMYNADCMDLLNSGKKWSLAIVDPPYGIGMSGGNVGYKGFNNLARKDWDTAVPDKQYFVSLIECSNNQIVWGGNYFSLPPTRGFLVWDKGEGFVGRTYAECEYAWTSFDKNAKIIKRDPLCNGDYRGKIHPTQKPVYLYKHLLHNYANPGDTILDTHGGSMSIAIACWDMGFDLDICELDSDYFNDAVKRFEQYITQTNLFNP